MRSSFTSHVPVFSDVEANRKTRDIVIGQLLILDGEEFAYVGCAILVHHLAFFVCADRPDIESFAFGCFTDEDTTFEFDGRAMRKVHNLVFCI